MATEAPRDSSALPLAIAVAIGLVLVLLSSALVVGADTMWLVAMGNAIARAGHVPVGVPFATADSSTWVNVPVLGELTFAGLNALGPLGLPMAQVAAVGILLALLAFGAHRAGGRPGTTVIVLLLFTAGSLPALGVVRSQMLSLVPFALLVNVLREEQGRPSRLIWLLPVLTSVWGNLHGAVLVGVAVSGCYLLVGRMRSEPWTAIGVGAATVASLFITPAGLSSWTYYANVLTNEAARRGTEMWSAPDLSNAFHVALLATAAILLSLALAARRPMWEYLAIAGLVIATGSAARHGVWLLAFLVPPAARGLTIIARRVPRRGPTFGRAVAAVVASGALLAAAALLSARTPQIAGETQVVNSVGRLANGRAVLATEPLSESLAASGIRVWVSNPIDAFSRSDQSAYLDFIAGSGASAQRALAQIEVVAAPSGSPAAKVAVENGFRLRDRLGGYDVLEQIR